MTRALQDRAPQIFSRSHQGLTRMATSRAAKVQASIKSVVPTRDRELLEFVLLREIDDVLIAFERNWLNAE
jgi:hypothetical protein